MPRNVIGDPPFPPIVLFDESRDFTVNDLERISRERPDGVSICVRYPEGRENRGGYFFHFALSQERVGEFQVFDFERRPVKIFPAASLVEFINHCTGRRFDERVFVLCQTELNFLKDDEPNA